MKITDFHAKNMFLCPENKRLRDPKNLRVFQALRKGPVDLFCMPQGFHQSLQHVSLKHQELW